MLNLATKTILVTGGGGFIGRAVVDNLFNTRHVPAANIIVPRSAADDLRQYQNCERLFTTHNIDVVIHLAAKVGGVGFSQKFPATQYYQNILVDLNVVEAANHAGIEKIVLVSSACAYPRDAPYPLKETSLWSGLPQETNRAYGIAKRLLTIQAEAYRQEYGLPAVVVIPNNAYGPGDNFDPEYSHVIPSIIRQCSAGADPLFVWGDGTPTRDFLYVKDFAEGVILAAERLSPGEPVNLGSGTETSISELVALIQKLTGHSGQIVFDRSRPNGQPRRRVDISRARELLGFTPRYSLEAGLRETIAWYQTTLTSSPPQSSQTSPGIG